MKVWSSLLFPFLLISCASKKTGAVPTLEAEGKERRIQINVDSNGNSFKYTVQGKNLSPEDISSILKGANPIKEPLPKKREPESKIKIPKLSKEISPH